jgi:hypothetical protein
MNLQETNYLITKIIWKTELGYLIEFFYFFLRKIPPITHKLDATLARSKSNQD